MSDRLKGRVAIVTGASRGIGHGIAQRFSQEGAKLVLLDIAADISAVARKMGGDCLGISCDVTKSGDVKAAIDETVKAYGRLDVLCNNAGIDGVMSPLAECSEENFDRIMSVNLRGVFLGMRHAIPAMIAKGGGVIVNIASIAGLFGVPGYSAYAASKAGVILLTKTAALEYARQHVRVNAICPGGVDTAMHQGSTEYSVDKIAEMTPLGRLASPAEIGAIAAFLASDDSAFITGTTVTADGGVSAQ